MKKKKSSKNISNRSKTAYLAVLILIVLVYLFVQGDHGFFKYIQLKNERKQLLQNIEELKEEKAALEKEIHLLKYNNDFVEKVAREEHLMAKEGETVYKINKRNE